MGCPSGRSPPYPRIKLCRAGKIDLSVFILRLLTSGISLAESPSFYTISFCHRISKKRQHCHGCIYSPGGRGYSGFQVIGMIEWGQKSGKTQKNPWTKISPLKSPMLNFRAKVIYSRNYAAGIRGNYHESSDCFEYPKKCLLKSSYPKKYLPKSSNPKIS